MKILVAYYSRTGNTKKVALEIARVLKAETDEIIDRKNRAGVLGYISAGRDGMKKNLTEISFCKKPENYDLVILGTPNWAGKMCSAVRTYIKQNKIKKAAYFCTQGGEKADTLDEMESLLGKGEKLTLRTKEVQSGEFKEKVQEFCRKIK